MKLTEIYPYWDDIHLDLLDVLEYLDEDLVDLKPLTGVQSIRQIVIGFAEAERFHIAHLVGGGLLERTSIVDYTDGATLISLLRASRSASDITLEPFTPAGLRAVRTLPGRPKDNQPETNVTVGWLVWHVLELEIGCLAQVNLRLADEKVKKSGRW